MKKVFAVVLAAQLAWVMLGVVVPGKAYAEKESLWDENFDAIEEGEETGLEMGTGSGLEVNLEVQSKIANGGKGKALKISPKEGVAYAFNSFGATKDMTYPNENATITFSYYASGISGVSIMTNDRTIPENCESSVAGLVQNKWTKVVLRVSKFKVKSPKGTIKAGDEFRYVYFIFGMGTGPLTEQFVVIDDIKLTIGEEDKGAGDKKKK